VKIEVPLPDFVRQIVKDTVEEFFINGKRLETCPLKNKLEITKAKIIGLIIGITIASSAGGALASQLFRILK